MFRWQWFCFTSVFYLKLNSRTDTLASNISGFKIPSPLLFAVRTRHFFDDIVFGFVEIFLLFFSASSGW